ncbi:hypothetical protein J2X01_002660 [Arthrobacter ginsengisoli]|uniref:Uncharacterized protein n=1 Tax=Arthrobacter ginsengisoli TaxID=1356565 RepID=A0ABU1UE08_9MICC|nr:hypothetical protein [Arthrobacter ginsengisoli]
MTSSKDGGPAGPERGGIAVQHPGVGDSSEAASRMRVTHQGVRNNANASTRLEEIRSSEPLIDDELTTLGVSRKCLATRGLRDCGGLDYPSMVTMDPRFLRVFRRFVRGQNGANAGVNAPEGSGPFVARSAEIRIQSVHANGPPLAGVLIGKPGVRQTRPLQKLRRRPVRAPCGMPGMRVGAGRSMRTTSAPDRQAPSRHAAPVPCRRVPQRVSRSRVQAWIFSKVSAVVGSSSQSSA